MDHRVWSTVFQYNFGLCHSFDLSNIKKYEFVPYNKGSRPGIAFYFAKNSPWQKIAILLHSKHDFPDAWLLNGKITLPLENNNRYIIDITKKISKRVSTRKSPCTEYEYNTCLNIEENKLVLDQFRCQIPILYFGQHLDRFIPSKTPKCNGNVTKEAIDLLNKSNQG